MLVALAGFAILRHAAMKWLLDIFSALSKVRLPTPTRTPVAAQVVAVDQRLTANDLAAATGARIDRATEHLPWIVAAMATYGIDTPQRQAAFLARIGHESGGLKWPQELWGPTPAQKRYEGRKDLGNTQPGDGKRFAGHGWIQVTGRFNHAAARNRMRAKIGPRVPDFEAEPEKLALPEWAAMSAADFWHANQINRFADVGDFDGVCDAINIGRKTTAIGDANGYAESCALWEQAKRVLS